MNNPEIYIFNKDITFENVDEFVESRPDVPYILYFSTEGGNTNASILLARILMDDPNLVSVIACGHVFSGGVLIFALLGGKKKRYALPTTTFLIHKMELNFEGFQANIRDTEKFLKSFKSLEDKVIDLFVRNTNLTPEQYKKLIEHGDFYFDVETALNWGYIDEILEV